MNASGSFTRNNNLKLHYQPIATYSQNVLIALYENGLQFDTEIVQLMNPDQYLRIT
jgi:glutathione S-transferase